MNHHTKSFKHRRTMAQALGHMVKSAPCASAKKIARSKGIATQSKRDIEVCERELEHFRKFNDLCVGREVGSDKSWCTVISA